MLRRVNRSENNAAYYWAAIFFRDPDFQLPEIFVEDLCPAFSAGGRASKHLLTISDVLRIVKASKKSLKIASVDMYERTRSKQRFRQSGESGKE